MTTDDRAEMTADDYVRAAAQAVGVDPDDAVAYRHRTLQANIKATDDRAAFAEARAAGKAIHQAQRLARVQSEFAAEVEPWLELCGSCDAGLPMNCTCPKGDYRSILLKVWRAYERSQAESKALAETATRLALQLGRNEMREEIAALCEKKLTYTANRGRRLELQELAAELRSGTGETRAV